MASWTVVISALLGGLVGGALAGRSGVAAAMASAPQATILQPAMPGGSGSNSSKRAGPAEALPDGSAAPRDPGSQTEAVGDGAGSWERRFASGMHYSKQAVDASESEAGRWAFDREGSAAAVPQRMLLAEQMLVSSASEATPEKKRKEKLAEVALRFYYHAKWLAEGNLATAAEWRYREASRVAKLAKRSVLAAHSLSRLGYFLMHWRRHDEAREVLLASEALNTKANPLGPFLYGVLERQAAGADVDRLHAAEERILRSGKQPSDDLETQRVELVSEINFWRSAEASPRACLQAGNVAHTLICLCSHAAAVFFGDKVYEV